jgi:carboxyl-terminal processing protease
VPLAVISIASCATNTIAKAFLPKTPQPPTKNPTLRLPKAARQSHPMQVLKSKILGLALGLMTAAHACAFVPAVAAEAELKPAKAEEQAAHLAAEILTRHHYKALPVDLALSGQIFDRFVKSLDPEKLFFVQGDIDRLSADRTRMGEVLFTENLNIPFAIVNLYKARAQERMGYARSLLKSEFDFDAPENLKLERSKQAWAQSEQELQEVWRKRVKNDWLSLKLAGKPAKGIFEVLDKRYDTSIKRFKKINNADALQVFMNAYTLTIDPHTNYLGLRAAEEFNIAMRLSLTGIGAVLTQADDYTTIRELIAGGPAQLSGKLKVGDRIVGVGQGNDEAIVDIMGWRQDDAVALIRGAADSVVRLEILPAEVGLDSPHKIVNLVRKPITLKEQAAKSAVQEVKDGISIKRIGIITLPSFYEDFAGKSAGAKDYRSASRDVEKLLEEFKRSKVDSVLVDLRGNGGGSLTEAIELTGLFIGPGPVVQQRNAQGKVWLESSKRAAPVWSGPMGVLINRGSASASEIFAAAVQDYGRGVVIGEPSFGKGTVQTVINLDRMGRSSKPQLGELKMTIAQFFRINGGTTQLRGVSPDIRFAGYFDDAESGEASAENALPWTQIPQVPYTASHHLAGLLPQLSARHEVRNATNQEYKYLQEDIAEYKRQRKKAEISLQETVRRKEREAREARLAARKADTKADTRLVKSAKGAASEAVAASAVPSNVRDDGLEPQERSLASDLAAEQAQKVAKDILLLEAAHILSDAVVLAHTAPRVAANDAQVRKTKTR